MTQSYFDIITSCACASKTSSNGEKVLGLQQVIGAMTSPRTVAYLLVQMKVCCNEALPSSFYSALSLRVIMLSCDTGRAGAVMLCERTRR